jgi:DNA-binding transcriptional ArsR family regulator
VRFGAATAPIHSTGLDASPVFPAAVALSPLRSFSCARILREGGVEPGVPACSAVTMTKRIKTPRMAEAQREAVYAMQAEICRVLGHPRRIQILDLLAEGERSAAQLLLCLRVSKVNLSQHMALLKAAGLVEAIHRGRTISYRLSFIEIKDACRQIRQVLAARLRQGTRLAQSIRRSVPSQSVRSVKRG